MSLGYTSVVQPAAGEARGLHHLYTQRQMEFILHRERARADRQQGEFSLVVFTLRGRGPQRSSALLRLARIVLGHARATDEIGYHPDQGIAAVLPGTARIG